MHLFAPAQWANMVSTITKDHLFREKTLRLDFLKEANIPQNHELASLIQDLFSSLEHSASDPKTMNNSSTPFHGQSTVTINLQKTQS